MREATYQSHPHEPLPSQSIGKSSKPSSTLRTVALARMGGNPIHQTASISSTCLNNASGVQRTPCVPQTPYVTHRSVPVPEKWLNIEGLPQRLTPTHGQAANPYQVGWPLRKAPHLNDGPQNMVSSMSNHELMRNSESTIPQPILASQPRRGPSIGWINQSGIQELSPTSTDVKPIQSHLPVDRTVLASPESVSRIPDLGGSWQLYPCATPYSDHDATKNGQKISNGPRVSRRAKIQRKGITGRKKRTLSPEGRDHAKKVRQFPGGACHICKRKKTKVCGLWTLDYCR